MSLADVTSARSSPTPETCPECDATASVTSDLHKYQVACTCTPSSPAYACAEEPGPPPPAKTDTPPALPPRPAHASPPARSNAAVGCNGTDATCRRRKYAWWCVGCGALAAALGGLLAAQHILLRAYTASPHHLETVPAAVPAAMLVLTGVCIMSLARRRNRYSYMIKVVGACCVVCALTCVLVTITTTVIHMNKLQTLKFCDYTMKTRTCTCYSSPQPMSDDEGVRCVFEGVSGCGVVHGALYWCLRGVFALSVSAVLVCIFSCMLAYQLLSHERKKMYWEQLELRCRSLYRPPTVPNTQTAGRPVPSNCNCCAQCHPTQPAWDISLQHRFWAPGRIGNLYSPNPGTGRKTSAWSWFPWPRSNSQNSRCRMGAGVPQSGDSAYGFCETDNPQNPQAQYEDRPYPSNYPQPFPRQNSSTFPQASFNQIPPFTQTPSSFTQAPSSFTQAPSSYTQPGSFPQSANFVQSASSFNQVHGSQGFQSGYSQDSFGEISGSYDAQTGVWGPPPPYSPQGRSGSRHHLHHTDPATATLLHHHHMDHRNSMINHDHPNHQVQPHTCRNSYLIQNVPTDMTRELAHLNPELARLNPEIARLNPEIARLNPEIARLNPDLARINQELARLNPELTHLAQMYSQEELSRLQDLGHLEGRFNTLRGHLVPYRNCQRSLGMSAGNLHRDCRMEDNMTIECLHQKNGKEDMAVCKKLGKENLAFQNDKSSPVRASMQDCHRGINQNAESEVYFADVSSCCNVSVKTDCCLNPNVSALVGTIESHPESTSESDTGSFTLTRQQRPQPQTSSKRRPRQEKQLKQEKLRQDLNNSLRLTEQQIEQLNNSLRMKELMNESRLNDSRDRLNERDRFERMNESRTSDRMNERFGNDMRMNESRVSERINESRVSERMNESRLSERMNETRLSERLNDSRIGDRMNESRKSERINDSRNSERNESRDGTRTDRIEGSPKMRTHISPLRLKPSPIPKEHPRQSSSDSTKQEFIAISPLSPNTEESLLSDDGEARFEDQGGSKRLAPDSQYENEGKEELKTNHHHCYSDTNTMDSGWQSGSEKQATD